MAKFFHGEHLILIGYFTFLIQNQASFYLASKLLEGDSHWRTKMALKWFPLFSILLLQSCGSNGEFFKFEPKVVLKSSWKTTQTIKTARYRYLI